MANFVQLNWSWYWTELGNRAGPVSANNGFIIRIDIDLHIPFKTLLLCISMFRSALEWYININPLLLKINSRSQKKFTWKVSSYIRYQFSLIHLPSFSEFMKLEKVTQPFYSDYVCIIMKCTHFIYYIVIVQKCCLIHLALSVV